MESYQQAQEALAEVERAAAAPYIHYPPTPRWYPPAGGLWAAGMVLTIAAADRRAVYLPAIAVLLLLLFTYLGWYRRRWRTMPSLRQAPTEIAGAYRQYFLGLVPVLVAITAASLLVGSVLGALVAFVTVTGLLQWYEKRYAEAAAETRARLA